MSLLEELTAPVRHAIVRQIAPKIYGKRTWAEEHRAVPRPMIKEVRRRFGDKPLVGLEVGIASGINAESVLQTLNIRMLYLVDPYTPYWQHETRASRFVTHYVRDFDEAMKRLAPFRKRYVLLKMKSDQAVDQVPEDLDFVYIDGDHNYHQVKRDLENFYPRTRSGGIIGGHDFYIRDHAGLIRAVIEFTTERNLRPHGDISDYWILKE